MAQSGRMSVILPSTTYWNQGNMQHSVKVRVDPNRISKQQLKASKPSTHVH